MQLEERVASALRTQADLLVPVSHELPAIRAAARARSRRRTAIAGGIVAGICASVALVVQTTGVGEDQRDDIAPVDPTISTPPPQETAGPIDTSAWKPYVSELYDVRLGYPGDWTLDGAIRAWRSHADSADPLSPAQEAFQSRTGDVRVSTWAVPYDPASRPESTADFVAWVEDYCEATGKEPCTGIEDRAVGLCLEARDCHPALLVPFESDVQAFFTGGRYDTDVMTVVAVWRPEDHRSVRPYGGARRLLEGFLSTMDVWPAPDPRP